MFCQKCGGSLGEKSEFCEKCGLKIGQPENRVTETKAKRRWPKIAVGVAVAIVVAFVSLGILISLLSGTNFTSPTDPVRSANITVLVSNDNLFSSKSCSVYIDGDLEDSGSIGPLSTEQFMLQVSWRGSTLHNAEVMVFSGGDSDTKTITLEDGGSGTLRFTI